MGSINGSGAFVCKFPPDKGVRGLNLPHNEKAGYPFVEIRETAELFRTIITSKEPFFLFQLDYQLEAGTNIFH
jgi:hypothetical protein